MARCKYGNDETKLALLPKVNWCKVEFVLITWTAGWKCIQNIIFKSVSGFHFYCINDITSKVLERNFD